VLLHLLLGAAVLGAFGLTRPVPPPAPVAVELVLLRDARPAEAAEPDAAAVPEPATPASAPPEPMAPTPAAPEPEPAAREAAPPEPVPAPAAAAPAAAPPRPPRPAPPRPAARPAPARPSQSAEPGSAAASQPPAAPAAAAPAVSAPEGPPVVTGARFRQRPTPPAYPEMARERGQTGTAILRALIGPGGETRDIRLHRSSGHALLDGAALQAVRRWLFEPATRDGRPIEAWVEVPVRFVLD
jgi:protein TonB